MIDLIKELWFKYMARKHRATVKRLTDEKQKLNDKQMKATKAAESYMRKYEDIKKL